MNWESLDWEVLDRLRETFLTDAKSAGPYWHTLTDLECYDLTYGERIGWKWDAVLRELRQRGWAPPLCHREPANGGCGNPVSRIASPSGEAGRLAMTGSDTDSPPPTAGDRWSALTPTRSERIEVNPLHPKSDILDWGCGSGVAGRRVTEFFSAHHFSRLVVHDHSALAMDYAEHTARKQFPGLTVERASVRDLRGDAPIGVLVVSHVLNELDDTARAELGELIARAQTVLWVEPGTHEVSRALVGWRQQWRSAFEVVAPCTHQAACGLLAPENARHWCHHFASPPPEIFADSNWVRFGQRAGIDLRALPYSFLVLARKTGEAADGAHRASLQEETDTGASRILGDPRIYKGYAKIFNCSAAGVEELTLQQRVDRALFKSLKRARGPLLYRWTREGAQITGAEPLFASVESPAADDEAHPDSGTA
ncbi:MAG: hypothetical protein HYV95_00065 [Opitutae bacterium]|nr:hypothetical protein [Opitutae bacterium]